ncbi:helix-turn-helix domain-containing protein [Streptomyces sp. NPDC057638]|uniref:helix-turn-helix domain-containing protein n=1 Tax=Streptomyces sp. NPDC057638 TaxID=3346190 RepID=UPI0036CAF899
MSAEDESLYRALLARPRATVAELATTTGWDVARLRRRLRSLERRGMLTRVRDRPARFRPAPPDTVVELLTLRRQEEFERARLAAAALTEEFSGTRREGPVAFQALGGPEAIGRTLRQILRATREELLSLDRPLSPVPLMTPAARGVRRRAIYGHRALDTPERLALSRERARGGEECRVLDEVPMRLLIADRRVALVYLAPMARTGGERSGAERAEGAGGGQAGGAAEVTEAESALLLRPSALLDGLVILYELLWQRSVPLWSPPPGTATGSLSYEDEQLLALSASGLTDQAIARRLGVAQRTVERRMRRIMDLLGARTRFQAGLQAAWRGIVNGARTAPGASPRR